LNYKVNEISDDLFLITLVPPLKGFSGFIGVWLFLGTPSFVVDVGPSSTAGALLEALDKLKVSHLDYILLTHIHLDHAGAIGQIAKFFPKTPIVCHQAAIPHLVDPSRLWQGTQKILGPMAQGYGPVTPVAERRLLAADQFQTENIVPRITPGHALHHVSYLTEEFLFAGETGGVFLSLAGSIEYLRPATPPKFFLNTALQSIDTLIAGNPSQICYGHFGLKTNAVERLTLHRNQLLTWQKIIRNINATTSSPDPVDACLQRLLQEDTLLKGFYLLSPDEQEREKFFLSNSIKGFLGYLMGE